MLEQDEFKRIGMVELSQQAGVTRNLNFMGDNEHVYKGSIGGGDFQNYLKTNAPHN